MKKRILNIVNGLILLLVVLYSMPVQYFHHCDRFKAHSDLVSVEEAHKDCYLCDIKLTPFLQVSTFQLQWLVLGFAIVFSFYLLSSQQSFIQIKNNKGPPAFNF
ncbi:MAG: hypothetical protein V4613_11245 [Bacteroidota bacterium]